MRCPKCGSKLDEDDYCSECCEFIDNPVNDVCPECGEPVESEYTRIVGFYTKVKTWSSERAKEFKMRKWEKINSTTEKLT